MLRFIPQLVLQAGPEVHGNGADLDLHRYAYAARGKENRNPHGKMKASITIGLGFLNIIPPPQHRHIPLPA